MPVHKITLELSEEQWQSLNEARYARMDREKRYIEMSEMVLSAFSSATGSAAAGKPAAAAPKRSERTPTRNTQTSQRSAQTQERPARSQPRPTGPAAAPELDPDEPAVPDEVVVKGLPEKHRYLRPIPGEAVQKGKTSIEERVRRYRYWLLHPQAE